MGAERYRWIFSLIDYDDNETYLDESGKEIDYSEAADWIGTDTEAAMECDRRSDAWEERYDALAAKITYHRMGRVA